jgi:hypothetical protein
MTRTIIATAIALALSGCAGNAPQVGSDTGSENGLTFGPGQTRVVSGDSGLLPENGSDGIVQSANSVPASTIYGTTAFANAAHRQTARHVAGGAAEPHG